MSSLGPHAGFIVASYVAAAVIILGLIGTAVLDYRRQRRDLAALGRDGLDGDGP